MVGTLIKSALIGLGIITSGSGTYLLGEGLGMGAARDSEYKMYRTVDGLKLKYEDKVYDLHVLGGDIYLGNSKHNLKGALKMAEINVEDISQEKFQAFTDTIENIVGDQNGK